MDGNVAVRRPIQLGATSVSAVEILSGLKVGDRVVIAGTDAFEKRRARLHQQLIPRIPTRRGHTMLRMTNLSKVYRTHMIETHALRGFDIHVKQGEFVAVTGPSGSGKTTFLNIAGLLETFSGGEYVLDGVNVKGLDDNARSRLRNEKLGFIFQGFNLIPDLNLFDNVDVPLRYRGFDAAERKRRIESALGPRRPGLAHAPLPRRAVRRPAAARGDRARPGRRAEAAARRRADRQPRFADGAWRDGAARGDQRAGTTILMVTHDPELAARAQRNVHIIDGQVSDLLRETTASLAAAVASANA
jgi:putative ABC transport system ATP-binding protein